jgi:hypothetical protein
VADNCKHCGKPLKESQFIYDQSGDAVFKSCPQCSANHGNEHIYYQYPGDFGTTDKRASEPHSDGPQSYCERCRANQSGPYTGAILCSEMKPV